MATAQSYTYLGLTVLLTVIARVQSGNVSTITDAQRYLSRYGYLPASAPSSANDRLMDEMTFLQALQYFQSFAGLAATGELDKPTMESMSLPRCGVHDKWGIGNSNRAERYELHRSYWLKTHLTYKILNYPRNWRVSHDVVDTEIARAFSVWSKSSKLTFTRDQVGAADIQIKFVAGLHDYCKSFDGPGGDLAHAYFPEFGGNAHFDNDEMWTISSYDGINLFQVAVHEIGHSLGLKHSSVKSSVMVPFYEGYEPNFELHPDDIFGIQSKYGAPQTAHQLCLDPQIDAIFNLKGETFVFKGDMCYKLNGNSVADGYPKYISEEWVGLPSNIDAAFSYENDDMFFFKDGKYWIYKGYQLTQGYPEELIDMIKLASNIRAALYRIYENKIYLFSGMWYWSFDLTFNTFQMGSLLMKGWPSYIDAAFEDQNGITYFFKGDKYYWLDNTTGLVSLSPYPYTTGKDWFGC